jgi:hypothetical protein
MIVPFPAGGGIDTLASDFGERMRPILGWALIIENVAGAIRVSEVPDFSLRHSGAVRKHRTLICSCTSENLESAVADLDN